jgi:hypothetical protein
MPMQAQRRAGGISPPILNLGARSGGLSTSRPGRHNVGNDPVRMYRKRVEPPGVSGLARKISTVLGFGPRTVEEITSLSTYYAIPAGHRLYLAGNDLFQRHLLIKYLRCTECSLEEKNICDVRSAVLKKQKIFAMYGVQS